MKKTILTLTASLFAVLAPAQNLISSGSPLYKLPYKNTYVMQTLVAENTFRTAKVEKPKPGTFEQARKVLPSPYWEGHQKEIEMYWKAWQIGLKNVCQPLDDSGFVTSYISPAYNGNIFMWDDAFITMFCRYGDRFFPFQKTLDNFYAKQHPDGFICREIRADGSDCFGRYDPTSTGPNLLPWSEWLYYTQFGDDNRLNKVFPVLAAYYKWLKLNRTWRNGTYWSCGWGTGMDNMPRVPEGYNTIYSNGHMIWLDACLQQIMVANILLKMGFYLERWQEIEEFEDDIRIYRRTSTRTCGASATDSSTISMPTTRSLRRRASMLTGLCIPMCCPSSASTDSWSTSTTPASSTARTAWRRSLPITRSIRLTDATGKAAYGPAPTIWLFRDSWRRAIADWLTTS